MPAAGWVGTGVETYDSKEFTGSSNSIEARKDREFYKFSHKPGNHLHSLGVLHRKK